MTISIKPNELNLKCVYTLLSAASHHDPNLGVDANINLYNRQLVRTPYQASGRALTDSHIQKIATAFRVPEEVFEIFADEPFPRFCGIALVKVFLDKYGRAHDDGDWGTGIFTGVEAYRRLSDRIELAAPRSANLKEFWSILLRDLQCGPTNSYANQLFEILAVPSGCHHEVLYHLEKHSVMVVEMARHWKQAEATTNAEYAKKAKLPQTTGKVKEIDFSQAVEDDEMLEASIPVPTHSGNDIRHDIRYAAMVHLFEALGLDLNSQLPIGVKAMFENGGNIKKGTSAPSTAYSLAQTIRKNYPSLGLLGGCTDSFLLGDSNLESVAPWWLGRENNDALRTIFGVEAKHSVVDMLDNWTLHRHSGRTHDVSPMPYQFETIAPGAKLYVNFQLSPWTPELELGAFWCALRTFMDIDSSIGGQSAKGFGRVKVDIHEGNVENFKLQAERYEQYLRQNLIELQEGLQTGELCTGQVVCS